MELTGVDVVQLPEAFTGERLAAIGKALAAAQRPLVVTGALPGDVFCRGLALEEVAGEHNQAAAHNALQHVADLLAALVTLPVPRIACVDGCAIGGGLGFAAACDVVLATPHSTFALPELLWGFFPAAIWPILRERVSARALERVALMGHAIDATEALRLGFVDRIVPAAGLEGEVSRIVRALHRTDASCLMAMRAWSRNQQHLGLAEAIQHGSTITAMLAARPATRIRLQRFLEGEAPWA